MSCFPERVYSVYVDGELPAADVRSVKAHLVQCERCRRTIVALEEEGVLLRSVLKEDTLEPMAAVRTRSRARALARAIGPAFALTVLGYTAIEWVLDQRLPQGMSWMNPLSFFGAYDMLFGFVFMARDHAPLFFDLGVAVGATAGSAALLTFLGTTLLRRATRVGAVGLLAVVLLSGVATPGHAVELRMDQQHVTVPASEKLDATLVASAETVVIDGEVNGDVALLAERIEINGIVRGNVLAGGRDVVVTGTIEGALFTFCEVCTLEGRVTGNLYSAAERLAVRETARVTRDAFLFGGDLRVNGEVGRDLFVGASSLELRGAVARNVATHTESVAVFESAQVGGDLAIETPPRGEVDVSPSARIGGETTQGTLDHPLPDRASRFSDPGFYMRVIVLIASAFLVGLVLHGLFPRLFEARLETSGDFGRCLGFGFLALIVTPLLIVFCFVTVIGIPIGILVVFVYLTMLFVSLIVIASTVGTAVLGIDREAAHRFGTALLVGLVIVAVATNLPFLGGPLRVLTGLAGMGLLAKSALDLWAERRADLV